MSPPRVDSLTAMVSPDTPFLRTDRRESHAVIDLVHGEG